MTFRALPSQAVVSRAAVVDVETERRRIRRWLYLTGVVLLIGFFGLLRYDYPTVRAADGTSYEIVAQGRQVGAGGTMTVFRFLSHSDSATAQAREVADLLPVAQTLADRQGDSLLVLGAVHRQFRYGLFTVDATQLRRYRRTKGAWYPATF